MSTAGYSGTALIRKPGIKPGMKVLLIHAPENDLQWLGQELPDQFVSKNGKPDLLHLFAASDAAFKQEIKTVLNLCKKIRRLSYGYPGIKKVQVLCLTCRKIQFVHLL